MFQLTGVEAGSGVAEAGRQRDVTHWHRAACSLALAALLKSVNQPFPRSDNCVAVLSADQLREALQSHTIDVGIGSFELATLSRLQFQAQPLFDCDVKLIFNPDYFPRGKSDAACRAGKSFDFPTDAGGALCAGLRDNARGAFIAVTACITGKYAPNGTLRCRSDCQARPGRVTPLAGHFFTLHE